MEHHTSISDVLVATLSWPIVAAAVLFGGRSFSFARCEGGGVTHTDSGTNTEKRDGERGEIKKMLQPKRVEEVRK